MASAQFAVEKLQRVFSVKVAELDSIIARTQQRAAAAAELDVSLADFASEFLLLKSSSPEELVTKIESDHAQYTASSRALQQKLSDVMKDVKGRCHNV